MKQKLTLKELVYNAMLQSIVNGEYVAGQILNEQTLIEQFGYSKSPIREALIMLCNEGVLRNIPRYGYEVVRLTANDIKEIMDYRRILECGLLQACFTNITKRQLDQLKEVYYMGKLQEKEADALTQWESNQSFHLMLSSFANNDYSYKSLQQALKSLKIAYAQTYGQEWENSAAEVVDLHVEIIKGIEEQNAERSVTALHDDLISLRL